MWLYYYGHLKSAHCRDKGVGEDLCLQKKDCPICKSFIAEQVQKLATPAYRTKKEKEHSKKSVNSSPATSTPILVHPKDCKLLGQVEGGWVLEETPAGKKKKPVESPKPSKKKSSSKPTYDDLKTLDDKWSQRLTRLEAIILAKPSAVSVEPV